jgi:cyclophilin family peptidyl-prolyl cis-trans isomerase
MPRLLATFVSALLLLASTGQALADNPKVRMETSEGTITIELYPDKAPKSVENFLAYVDEGHYDGTVFHRVIDGFMIQGGGFTDDLQKKPTKNAIENEADNGLKNERGTIAMARTGDPHSATSQFFINHKDNDFLNHSGKTPRGWGYAVFGKVTDGMDVVDKIATAPTGGKGPFPTDVPKSTIVIEKVTRIDG